MFYKNLAIGFFPDLVSLILNGSKTLTYRIGDKYDYLKIGDEIMVKDSKTGKDFAKVRVTEKSLITFKELPIDTIGHEVYASKEEQRKTFEKYYKKSVKDDEKILVLGFMVVQAL